VVQLYPQAPSTHFSCLLRHAWVKRVIRSCIILSVLSYNYDNRLQSSWTHLITPSQNFMEVRWRSLFRSTSLGKLCTSYKAPPTSRKRAEDRWSLRNFLPRSSLFMVGKAQKSHGARSELNSEFDLDKFNLWNLIRTSAIQSMYRRSFSYVAYIAANGTMICELERMWKEAVVDYFNAGTIQAVALMDLIKPWRYCLGAKIRTRGIWIWNRYGDHYTANFIVILEGWGANSPLP
jgi:hypothetical protein